MARNHLAMLLKCSHADEELEGDWRLLRLMDVAESEAIWLRCGCGKSVCFLPGSLQRQHRMPSDTLIYDLQFRFKCRYCGRNRGFRITVEEERKGSLSDQKRRVKVVVP